ncbi:hypothetical protein ACFZB9_14030 [Kitasatospora sp. NPDC008050]|uniref:hypothetical protein n=1 Tax=Kitasatospora sp. NPDC008050 TaxID=3364021 RepID=UPI0036EDD311
MTQTTPTPGSQAPAAAQGTAYHAILTVQTSRGRILTTAEVLILRPDQTRSSVLMALCDKVRDQHGGGFVVLFFALTADRLEVGR